MNNQLSHLGSSGSHTYIFRYVRTYVSLLVSDVAIQQDTCVHIQYSLTIETMYVPVRLVKVAHLSDGPNFDVEYVETITVHIRTYVNMPVTENKYSRH